MDFTFEHVSQMAPDSAPVSAGKKLMGVKNWRKPGRNRAALREMCLGSTVYQVKVDLSNLGNHCSCPSRKFLCKQVPGLMMLVAEAPDRAFPGGQTTTSMLRLDPEGGRRKCLASRKRTQLQ